MKTVLVFKTSVRSGSEVRKIGLVLDKLVDKYEKWSFDLEDCDRVLRIETISLQPGVIIESLRRAGVFCSELE